VFARAGFIAALADASGRGRRRKDEDDHAGFIAALIRCCRTCVPPTTAFADLENAALDHTFADAKSDSAAESSTFEDDDDPVLGMASASASGEDRRREDEDDHAGFIADEDDHAGFIAALIRCCRTCVPPTTAFADLENAALDHTFADAKSDSAAKSSTFEDDDDPVLGMASASVFGKDPRRREDEGKNVLGKAPASHWATRRASASSARALSCRLAGCATASEGVRRGCVAAE